MSQSVTRPNGHTTVFAEPRTKPLDVKPSSIALPSQFLFATNNPMPWVPAVKTDIRQTFARVRAQEAAR